MKKDIFGITPNGFQKRTLFEKERVDLIKKVLVKVFEEIKLTPEKDGWHRLVIFNNEDFFKGMPYSMKSFTLYFIRRHPNIISKLSDKERPGRLDIMKPCLFKWVTAEEKEKLYGSANYFRNLSSYMIQHIESKFPGVPSNFFVDIFSILEFLCAKKDKKWVEVSLYSIVGFSGVPVENARAAFNELLKKKLVVFAYVACKNKKGRLKLNVRVTLSEAEYERAISGEGIDAVKIYSSKDATSEKFNFTVVEYFEKSFRQLLENKVDEEETEQKNFVAPSVEIPLDLTEEPVEEKVVEEKLPEKKSFVERLPKEKIYYAKNISDNENFNAVEKTNYQPQVNVVVPEVKGLSQAVGDIRQCVVSLANIADSMYKGENQRNELLNNILKTNTKQREEYDDLYNQMTAMKKLLNKQEKDKDIFLKAVQDALNMMMGKIISETDEFAKIPRHQLTEYKLQKHKADVIQIAVQTAEDIKNLSVSNS